ncbi:hypothetical protein [Kangiella aquimarina]|uniref:Uncharacterized protein n=1 Tax=Kangiella aquimarina TaxID=261965 RepID=A0ABZ0X0T4_9GAMM|nr:hypothetical protein [Kangiella aquimarina]WQG84145.1 hypothetical protein SR900_06615 [Kangiella aquimarina]
MKYQNVYKWTALILSVVFFLSACKSKDNSKDITPEPVTKYKITTEVVGGGEISDARLGVEGEIITISIRGYEDYELSKVTGCEGNLTGDVVEQTFIYTVTVTSDCHVLATFTRLPRNEGGTINKPIPLSFDKKNNINVDSDSNYFSVSLSEGERLYLSSTLESRHSPLEFNSSVVDACLAMSSNYNGGIRIIDTTSTCGYTLAYTQDVSGEKIIHIDYPDGNYSYPLGGYFYADIVGQSGVELKEANGKGGTPSNPRKFLFGDNVNDLVLDSFFNFYAYNAAEGETINIRISSGGEIGYDSMCLEDPSYNSAYAFGVSVNGSDFSCSRAYEFTFPKDGLYVFHIKVLGDDPDIWSDLGSYFYAKISK